MLDKRAASPSSLTAVPRLRRRSLLLTGATLAVVLMGTGVPAANASTPAAADGSATADNVYERGPTPTATSIEAVTGPFAIAQVTVARSDVSGFGGGTIYYPTDTTAGTFGAVVIAPGFVALQSNIAWYGPRLASQGFVVFTIDTLTTADPPDSRAVQLVAAVDYLSTSSPVATRIDAHRIAVMGHSMGGGGSLAAAVARPSLQAVIALNPFHPVTAWPEITVPTLVIGSDNDTTAPVDIYAKPIYESLPDTLDKAYLELKNADHLTATEPNVTIARYSISWLKRFVDDDTRYEQFLCPPSGSAAIEEYRHRCP